MAGDTKLIEFYEEYIELLQSRVEDLYKEIDKLKELILKITEYNTKR